MRKLEELCNLIMSSPSSLLDIDWAEETNNFDIQRMYELVLNLNDMEIINAVIALIISEWNVLKSINDPRCYIILENGNEELKFPDPKDYSHEPICDSNIGIFLNCQVSTKSITGLFYLIKIEAYRKLKPIMERKKIQEQIKNKYCHQTNNEHVGTEPPLPDPVQLLFFDNNLYITAEEQNELRKILQAEIITIDKNNGRHWFAFYATYRYVRQQNGIKHSYVDFFSDIENLLPGYLTMLNFNEKGDKRFKHYTIQLSKEVDCWYVDNGSLPPINTLVYSDYHFGCNIDTFNKLHMIILRLYGKIHSLEERLKKEKGIG